MRVAYPIRVVARITGIHPDTIRAWERRHQAVNPERSGRRRVFSRVQIERLILLRDAIARGHSIGRIAGLTDSQLRELLTEHADIAVHSVERFESREMENPLLIPIVQALEALHPADAQEELSRLAWLMPAPDMIHRVILPLLRIAGDRWHRGAWSIAQEHLTSALLRNLMGTQIGLSRSRTASPKVLTATPSGEMHEFGAMAAACLAASCGLEPIYLGPNLPAADLVFAAERSGAAAVILGLTSPMPEPGILKELAWMAEHMPASIALWLGGSVAAIKREPLHSRYTLLEDFHSLERQLIRLRQGAGV
jgi:MerR family transcriptional regulator, light-induced transcriptional regulator